MLPASGFHVIDLGVDVATETFVEEVKQPKADLVGLSALLTTTMTAQREVLRALKEAGVRDQVKVMMAGRRLPSSGPTRSAPMDMLRTSSGWSALAKRLLSRRRSRSTEGRKP